MVRKILLRYTGERAKEPILAQVIKETGLTLDILYAEFGTSGVEVLISIDAPDKETDRVIDLFKKKGVEVKEVKKAIHLDRDSCMDCGACVSLCPSGALRTAADRSIELDEDKCVYCELCVPSCPVRALKLSPF